MTTPAVRVWYALVVLVLSLTAISFVSIQYANHVDRKREQSEREADRRWCDMLSTLDDIYRANPPATETGRKVARNTANLRRDFGCGVSTVPMGTPSPLPSR